MRAGKPRRLLVVIDEMEVGGSQRQIAHLLGALDRSRWQPELLYFRRHSFLVEQIRQTGVTVHHLPKRGRIDPLFVLRLAAFLRRERYDLVHAFSLTAELWTFLASRLMRPPPPIISSVRSLNLDAPGWHWRLKEQVIRRSAAVIANAEAAAEVASALAHIPRDRIDVIGNGVSLPDILTDQERKYLRQSIHAPAGRAIGLFVGRLTTVKNLPCLLEALASLEPAQRPWMALAGSGPCLEMLQQRRSELELNADVTFLGERQDAPRLMQAADFLVLSSDQEGLSNALLEAMAASCPVIASNVGGNPELVAHGHTGLLFPPGDSAALASALATLTNDRKVRLDLSRNALATASGKHGIRQLTAATQDVYERCLATQRTGLHTAPRFDAGMMR